MGIIRIRIELKIVPISCFNNVYWITYNIVNNKQMVYLGNSICRIFFSSYFKLESICHFALKKYPFWYLHLWVHRIFIRFINVLIYISNYLKYIKRRLFLPFIFSRAVYKASNLQDVTTITLLEKRWSIHWENKLVLYKWINEVWKHLFEKNCL